MTPFDLPYVGRLRAVASDDLEMMLAWRNAPNVCANMYSQQEIALSEHLTWWDKIKASNRDVYFIFEQGGTPLGVVSFNDISAHQTAFWAFYASPEAPKCTGSRMETITLEYCFSQLELNKLCCEVLKFNTAVVGLHKKFGFVEEGFFQDQRRIGTHYASVHRLAVFASQRANRRADFLPATPSETTS
ncbi:MAG: UDP-4-amino-4,6-dideoxy-N-acetyl-beta-L-altrosamine N-acetyltransferase [Octadecabacter sp.]|jgi:UDP-4-amino-4,6-dideoxy-N-acetyl-beta-L-altrosamine N-acetyltransferase|nr:UDP-4-amino-4,6-dideoxy-N-acetyl-beta-L-altrosamine N-acetyltransferase [Octadecabacter sp.]